MSKVVLKAEDISKQYRLGLVGTGTVKDDMKRWWYKLRGMEDPFLKIGEANDRSTKGESDYVWSLRDINFEINQGDSVGIIGRNGAGKSTLLKILSQVTQPTTGKIYTKGRIASLLEVGTGFHPEMTGRENIYLNGAILGMRKKEITRKLDEIIDFSGVERYIDTPVKRYSSGMYVRLAFAVAAHLESEILIVDEVLAVGDAEFQKKCLGKMNDVSKGEGRTVLFVSHNMAAIKSICNSGIVLENGQIKLIGEIDKVLDVYNQQNTITEFKFENEEISLNFFKVVGQDNVEIFNISNGKNFCFRFSINLKKNAPKIGFCIAIYNELGELITAINSYHLADKLNNLKCRDIVIEVHLPKYIFNTGVYSVNFHVNDDSGNLFQILERVATFIVFDDGYRRGEKYAGTWPGKISLIPKISINEVF